MATLNLHRVTSVELSSTTRMERGNGKAAYFTRTLLVKDASGSTFEVTLYSASDSDRQLSVVTAI